jgi:hypothetical protein
MREFFEKLKVIAGSKNQNKEIINDIVSCA